MKTSKFLALLLAFTLALSLLPAGAAASQSDAVTAVASPQTFTVDGAGATIKAYNIGGSNYIRLRDLAYSLKDTAARFSVAFGNDEKRVDITRAAAYAPVGGEGDAPASGKPGSWEVSRWAVYVDGYLSGMSVYNIDGSNYFKLADLGTYLGFGVSYDEKTNTAAVDSAAGYTLAAADFAEAWAYDEALNAYCLPGAATCAKPADPADQCLSLYVPAAYMDASGSPTKAVVNGYYADTAPVFMSLDGDNAVTQKALSMGYVVAAPNTGAEHPLADLKAAVRYLKANDAALPGDCGLIIAEGTGAEAALCAQLSLTATSADDEAALTAMGAAAVQDDGVYASVLYCPEAAVDGQASPEGYPGLYGAALTAYLQAHYMTKKNSGPNVVTTIDTEGATAFISALDPEGKLVSVNYDTLEATVKVLDGLTASAPADTAAWVKLPAIGETLDGYYYIRTGTKDSLDAVSASAGLSSALKAAGATVNFALQWGYGHEGGYELDSLFAWTERVAKYENQYAPDQIETILNLKNSIAGGDYAWTYNEESACYTIRAVTAVANPELEAYEGLSVCVPAVYVKGLDEQGGLIIDYAAKFTNPDHVTFTAATAPIIINTGAAGYSSGTTGGAGTGYVSYGYINVSCGNRGKNNVCTDAEGNSYYCGDAPYCLVDQKAVVRYLKYNIGLGNLPGDGDRIVSTGGSGGGAHSLMLAATGNHPDFYPYLEESGAVGVYYDAASDAYTAAISDAIWGCCPYSPITNLEEADMAYEWEASISETANDSLNLDQFSRLLSSGLAKEYVAYVNGLGLKYDLDGDGAAEAMTINEDGKSGPYVDYLVAQAESDLNWFLNNLSDTTGSATWNLQNGESYAEAYFYGHYTKKSGINGLQLCGKDLSTFGFTLGKDENGKWAVKFDVTGFLNYRSRSKTNPAFDTLTLRDRNGDFNAENMEFGDQDEDAKHWDKYVLKALTDNYDALEKLYTPGTDGTQDTFEGLYQAYSDGVNQILAGDEYYKYTDSTIVELYNPLRYILDEKTEQPAWVRLVHGTLDKDVSLMSTQNDAIGWSMMGVDVGLYWSWDNVHVASDPLNTSKTAYIDAMCLAEDAGK